MKKTYVYQQSNIVSYILYLSLAIIIGIVPPAMIGIPETMSGWLLFILFILLAISLSAAIIVSIVNNLKTKIEVDGKGIHYKSIFKNVFIAWGDIKSINKKYLQFGAYGYPSTDSQPKDLLILSKNGKSIKIFDCLDDNDGTDKGMKEFESEILGYTNGRIHIA